MLSTFGAFLDLKADLIIKKHRNLNLFVIDSHFSPLIFFKTAFIGTYLAFFRSVLLIANCKPIVINKRSIHKTIITRILPWSKNKSAYTQLKINNLAKLYTFQYLAW